jgi:hypothetical protein
MVVDSCKHGFFCILWSLSLKTHFIWKFFRYRPLLTEILTNDFNLFLAIFWWHYFLGSQVSALSYIVWFQKGKGMWMLPSVSCSQILFFHLHFSLLLFSVPRLRQLIFLSPIFLSGLILICHWNLGKQLLSIRFLGGTETFRFFNCHRLQSLCSHTSVSGHWL